MELLSANSSINMDNTKYLSSLVKGYTDFCYYGLYKSNQNLSLQIKLVGCIGV